MRNAQTLCSTLNYLGPTLCFVDGNNNCDKMYNRFPGENKNTTYSVISNNILFT